MTPCDRYMHGQSNKFFFKIITIQTCYSTDNITLNNI